MDKQASFIPSIHPRGGSRRSTPGGLVRHLALLILFGILVIVVNPRGYTGGGYDDGRYLAAATDWALHGPVLGTIHWALRWPLVLPTAAILRLAGPDHGWLMLPGIVSFFALGLVNYFGVRAAAGERAAFLAALGIMATPGIAFWCTAIYPDVIEVALWSAAFWSLWQGCHAVRARQMRWMVATGFLIGLAICVRETSIALAGGLLLASFFLPRLPLRVWIAALAAAAALPAIEYAILWVASGDPLYRLHVDLHHIAVPSHDMKGSVAKGQFAVLNTSIMERWDGAGPVHVHWLVDTWINFFLNFYYGFAYVLLAVLAIWAAGTRQSGLVPRGLTPALLALAGANIVWNLYVLALNPSDRMFMPATVAASILAAILADGLWRRRFVRPFVMTVMAIKLLSTLIVADTIPNYHRAVAIAPGVAPSSGRINVGWETWSHLALVDPAFRRRLDTRPTPVGGHLITFSSWGAPYGERLEPGHWRLVRSGVAGNHPYTIRLAKALIAALGLRIPIRQADVEVRIFQRLPGPSSEPPVLLDAAGRPVDITVRSR